MNVKVAKKHIVDMELICEKAVEFEEKHRDLEEELDFLFDAVAYLGDYMKMLDRLIDEAELKI